jgi:hypothetical protein
MLMTERHQVYCVGAHCLSDAALVWARLGHREQVDRQGIAVDHVAAAATYITMSGRAGQGRPVSRPMTPICGAGAESLSCRRRCAWPASIRHNENSRHARGARADQPKFKNSLL